MKNARRLIFLFFLPLLISALILEGTLRSIPTSYETKAQQIEACAPKIEVLFMGASHIYMGVRPSLMNVPAYNLAQVSQTAEYDFKLLKRLVEEKKVPQLKTVVLNIDAGILFDPPLSKGNEAFRTIYYHRDMGLDKSWLPQTTDFEVSSYTNVKLKLSSLGEKNTSPDCDAFGFYTGYDVTKKEAFLTSETHACETAKRHTAGGLDAGRANAEIYRNIVRLCLEQHWNVVVLRPPCTAYYAQYVPEECEKFCMDFLHELQNEYHVRIGDYSRDSRFSENDFYDSAHLTLQGATKFTQILCHDFGW